MCIQYKRFYFHVELNKIYIHEDTKGVLLSSLNLGYKILDTLIFLVTLQTHVLQYGVFIY